MMAEQRRDGAPMNGGATSTALPPDSILPDSILPDSAQFLVSTLGERPLVPVRDALPFTNVPPTVTPLTADRRPDGESIRRLVDHVVNVIGHQYLFVMGETGGFRFFGNEMRLEAIKLFIEAAEGRAEVFANATAETPDLTRRNIERLCELGAAAIVIAPLWGKGGDNMELLKDIAANHYSGIPLFLYNNPHITGKRNLTADELQPVRDKVAAIKDSSGNPEILDSYLDLGLKVYQGDELQIVNRLTCAENRRISGAVASMGNINGVVLKAFDGSLPPEKLSVFQRAIELLVPAYTCNRTNISGSIVYLLQHANIISNALGCNPDLQLSVEQRESLEEAALGHRGLLLGKL